MSLFEMCQWIESSPSSTALRESIWMFPIIESSHVLGLAFSVGTAVWFDLRLAGLSMRRYSVSETFVVNRVRRFRSHGNQRSLAFLVPRFAMLWEYVLSHKARAAAVGRCEYCNLSLDHRPAANGLG